VGGRRFSREGKIKKTWRHKKSNQPSRGASNHHNAREKVAPRRLHTLTKPNATLKGSVRRATLVGIIRNRRHTSDGISQRLNTEKKKRKGWLLFGRTPNQRQQGWAKKKKKKKGGVVFFGYAKSSKRLEMQEDFTCHNRWTPRRGTKATKNTKFGCSLLKK